MRAILQHWFNGAHLYCRLRLFMGKRLALQVAGAVEYAVNPFLYR